MNVKHEPVFREVCVSEKKHNICQLKYAFDRLKQYFSYQKEYFSEIKQFNKKKKNGDHRINRFDGREALYQVSKVLFSNLELSTMTIEPSKNSSNGISHENLIASCNGLSKSRYKRAFLKLKKAGFVETDRQFERSQSNKYYALPAIKRVTYKFFKALGIEKYYEIGKNWKIKKLEQAGISRKLKKVLDTKIYYPTILRKNNNSDNIKYDNKPKNMICNHIQEYNLIENKNNSYTNTDELRKKLLLHKINESLKHAPPNEGLFSKFKQIIYGYSEEMLLKAATQLGLE